MKRDLKALEGQTFDLLVIGGGIFGACAAWDATLRGLSVALVERADFCSGASANSFKVIHGGIRYIQHGDLIRLRESCHERTAWLRMAPHLVAPLPIVIPTYGHGREGKAFLGTGMLLYDLCTLDRNRGIRDPRGKIPFSGFMNRADVERLFPGVRSEGLTGGTIFYDGQMYNPPRLALAVVRAAVERGAVAVNYAEATRLLRAGDAVAGAEVRDAATGDVVEVKARAVLNAAGPWVPWMAESDGLAGARGGTFSRDACFLIRRRFPGPYGVAVQGSSRDPDALIARSARHMFLLPWRDYTLCGVWHVVWPTRPDTVRVPEADLEAFVADMNHAFPALELGLDDVTIWNAGLVPFGENAPDAKDLSYGKRSRIVDHAETDGFANLVSLTGIRYTMGRRDAGRAVDLICRKLDRSARAAPTDRTPIDGGDFDDFEALVSRVARAAPAALDRSVSEALAHNYGAAYGRVLSLLDGESALGERLAGATTLKAEVVHAVRDEMALRLTDIVFRRTDLATGSHPGRAALDEAADLAARELGWDEQRTAEEIAAVERRFTRGAALEEFPAGPQAARTAAAG